MRHHDYAGHRPKPQPGASLFDLPIIERVAKCVRLLDSPVDGEALAAARGLQRTLNESGRDLHFLADIIRDGWRDPEPVVVEIKKPKPRPEWQLDAQELLRHPEILLTKPDEFNFLTNMSRSRYAPTAKQQKWMGDIRSRIP